MTEDQSDSGVSGESASTGQPLKSAIDFDEVRRTLPGDEKVLFDIAEIFVDEGPELVEGIQNGVTAGNNEFAKRCAHTLKSSAHYLCMHQVVRLAAQVEQLSCDGKLSIVEQMQPELRVEVDRAVAELRDYLAAHSDEPR